MVVKFATSTLSQVLTLQQINTHFRRVMRNPIMVSHISVMLGDLDDVRNLGSLEFGVRYFECMALPMSAPLELLAHLPAIHCLDLSHGKFGSETFQVAIMSLHSLQQLDLSFCRQLVRLQTLPVALRVLDVMYCTRLMALPPMPNLERLDASHCPRLLTLPDLPALVDVDLGYSTTAIGSPYTQLRHLKIGHHTAPECERLTNLDTLCLVDCNFEHEWMCAPLTKLTALTLVFVSYPRAHDLTCLSLLIGLQKLQLEIGVSDDNLTCLETLVNVKHLAVGSELISDHGLKCIGKMRSLETLYINNCRRRQITGDGLVALAPLTTLRSLHLSECYGVDYRGLSALTQLRALCIDNDVNLYDRWPITPEEEWIDQMVRQNDLRPLTLLHNLTTLELLYCRLKSLRWLNKIPGLAVLVIKGCHLTRKGLWDLTPCHISSVILGECTRATLGQDLGRYMECVPKLTFEGERRSLKKRHQNFFC
jgi:Leucine-rich repeat (LRR) protein